MRKKWIVVFAAAFWSFFAHGAVPAQQSQPQPQPRPGWSFTEVARIPVQSGGRLKPMDSFAREIVLFMTGSRSFQGWSPMELLLSWIAEPQKWMEVPFIRITREDVRRQLSLDDRRTFYSPSELAGNPVLAQYAVRLGQPQSMASPMGPGRADPREKELRQVFDKLGTFRNIVSGDGWPVVPKASPEPWSTLAATDQEGEPIRARFASLLHAYQNGDREAFARAAPLARAAVEARVQAWESVASVIRAEVVYNRLRPFLLAWISYLLATLLWLNAARSRIFSVLGSGAFVIGLASHLLGFGLRIYISGRPPVSNMYESIVWVALGAVIFGVILFFWTRQWIPLVTASAVGAFALIAGDLSPTIMDPSIQPLVPVLRSNLWLTVHVLTITLGYAAFALTLGLSNVTLFHFLRPGDHQQLRIVNMNQLNYRAMQFGVTLLAAGTILGGVWADYSWGRFWGWDPKEVWALIALLCYLAILHGRYANWVGQFGYAAWSVVAFLSVIMAWYGVNFVLGVGLHSYGFSTGGRGWVGAFCALQLSYVGWVAWRKRAAASSP